MRAHAVPLICLAFALGLPAGTAIAQATPGLLPSALELRLAPLEAPIEPVNGLAVLQGEATYAITTPAAYPVPTRARFTLLAQPAWSTVTVSPAEIAFTLPPGATTTTERFQVLVTVNEHAPAFIPEPLRIELAAEPNALYAPETTETVTPLIAGFHGTFKAAVTPDPVPVPDGGAIARLVAANTGNAMLRLRVAVESAPPGLRVGPISTDLILESASTGGDETRREYPFPLQWAEGSNPTPGTVTLAVTSAYPLDASIRGPTQHINFTILPDGEESGTRLTTHTANIGPMPALPLPATLGALGAAIGLVAERAWRGRKSSR